MSRYSVPAAVNAEEYEFELEREEARYRARRGLLAFTLYTKPGYNVGWHHRELCRKLNAFARGEIKRLMVFMPPRHGKSELVSRRLPAFILGKDPNAKIIAASHTADLANAMNRDVQKIIDSEKYLEIFPETRLSGENVRTLTYGSWLRNSEEFEVVGFEGAYKCAGVGGALSGRGGNFLLLDDPIKDNEQAQSLTYREKLWDWYNTVFATRAEKDAGILITLTRWHEDDLAGRLLALAKSDPEADQWEVVNFPAIKDLVENEADEREEGEALWPWKYPIEKLKTIRATAGSRVFNGLYQQRPSAEEGDILKREWMLKRYKYLPELHKGRWSNLLVSADLRFKKDENSGDWVVYQVWARVGAQIYFLGESRGRWGFTKSVTEFQKISASSPIGNFKSPLKLVENKANGPALEDALSSKISGIVLVEPDGGKLARVNAVTPLWEAGNIWLPDDSIYPAMPAIVEEWVNFGPGCKFDDRADTMSQALVRFQREIDHSLEDITRW